MRLAVSICVFLLGCMTGLRAQPAAPEINLLAFANGALIERSSSTYGGGWEAVWLTDEDPSSGWASVQSAKPPFEIVISLPERSEIRRLEFDNARVEAPDRGVKDIDVLISDQSATAGFVPLASVALQPGQDGQQFTPAKPGIGRWVKLVIKSTQGSTEYAELMDVRGYGVALTSTPLPNVSGTYDSAQFGKFHLQQDGAQLVGCYEHKEGLVQGGLEGQLMRLRWREGDDGGPAVMVQTRDGKGFVGFWTRDGAGDWHNDWDLRKVSTQVGSCAHWNPRGSNANAVTAGLAAEGRIRLYGINFDTASAVLRPDATPALQQILAALKANPNWRITIEGHTDSTGTPDGNRDLSNRRAASVKAFLVTNGIPADRISSTGFGQDQPVATNDTSLGRSQNRRVELVKQ